MVIVAINSFSFLEIYESTDCLRGDGGNDVVGAACVMFDVVVVVVSDDDDDNDDKQLDAGVSIAISTDLLILPPQRSDTDTNKYHLLLTSLMSIHIISVSGYKVGAQTEYLCNSRQSSDKGNIESK